MATLRERHGFFDSIDPSGSDPGDIRMYNSDEFSVPWRYYMTNGVLRFEDNLQVIPGDDSLTTIVQPGFAMIEGRHYVMDYYGEPSPSDVGLALTHTPAVSANRIDRIVLQLNLEQTNEGRYIRPAVKAGTEGGGPPALTRDANVYELSLAQVLIRPGATTLEAGDITDERPDSALCGRINKTGDEPPMTAANVTVEAISGLAAGNVQAALEALQGGKVPTGRTVYGEALTANISPAANKIPATNPVSGGGDNVQGALNSLFTLASNGKAAVAGAIGSPATSGMTHAQLRDTIDANKLIMANNLAAKGVSAGQWETMQALAHKISSIQLGALVVEEYVILASGNFTFPSGSFRCDIFMVSGGAGGRVPPRDGGDGIAQDARYGGNGGNVLRVDGIAVTSGQVALATVGAGGAPYADGGITTFMGHTATGGVGRVDSYDDMSKPLWDLEGNLRLAGSGCRAGAVDNREPNYEAGGGTQAGTGYTAYPGKANMGGGGGAGNWSNPQNELRSPPAAGGSGRIHVRVYRR